MDWGVQGSLERRALQGASIGPEDFYTASEKLVIHCLLLLQV